MDVDMGEGYRYGNMELSLMDATWDQDLNGRIDAGMGIRWIHPLGIHISWRIRLAAVDDGDSMPF